MDRQRGGRFGGIPNSYIASALPQCLRFTTTRAIEADSIPCAQLDLGKDRASLQPVTPHSLRVGASRLHGTTKARYNDESGGTPMRT